MSRIVQDADLRRTIQFNAKPLLLTTWIYRFPLEQETPSQTKNRDQRKTLINLLDHRTESLDQSENPTTI